MTVRGQKYKLQLCYGRETAWQHSFGRLFIPQHRSTSAPATLQNENCWQETCRHAQVVFDKFHVIAHANQAVDEVRRAEVRLGGAGVWEALRQSQWLWRKNPEKIGRAHV